LLFRSEAFFMPDFIELHEVHFSYSAPSGPAIPALGGLDLTLRRGEYWVILGRNGSGKSTLARLLNGLLAPTSGQVLVDGLDTRDPAALREVRRRVGLVFQVPDNQLIANTVEEDVAFGPENLGIAHEELVERVRTALATVGMSEQRQRPPHLLSAGQKQRVAIAGILAMRPDCLVLDEATAMLDPAGRRDVLELVVGLHRAGTTVVAITHHMVEALTADRVAVLHEGKLALTGTPREIFAQTDKLHEFGLSLPPIPALAWELHRRCLAFPTNLLTVAELADAIRDQLRVRAR
jgi:energy-coupling factor transporter ATPase